MSRKRAIDPSVVFIHHMLATEFNFSPVDLKRDHTIFNDKVKRVDSICEQIAKLINEEEELK